MKQKCYAFLRHKAGATIKKAAYYPESGVLEYRERIFKPTVLINVPETIRAEPYRRRRNIFFVDVEKRSAVPTSGTLNISEASAATITDKLDAIAIKRYWKFLGGRALTTVETLIFLAAGYGALRFVEYAIQMMYG